LVPLWTRSRDACRQVPPPESEVGDVDEQESGHMPTLHWLPGPEMIVSSTPTISMSADEFVGTKHAGSEAFAWWPESATAPAGRWVGQHSAAGIGVSRGAHERHWQPRKGMTESRRRSFWADAWKGG